MKEGHSSVTCHRRESLKAETKKGNQIMKNLNIQFKPTAGLLIPLLLAAFALMFLEYDARAQSAGNLPPATRPRLVSDSNYRAEFNQFQIECYLGSMKACDKIGFSQKLTFLDSWLKNYGKTCGGRVNRQRLDDLNFVRFRKGLRYLNCRDIFPGH
jgi:hypothetical protein